MLRIDIITLFPEYFESALQCALLGKALAEGRVNINRVWLREFGEGSRRTVDDVSFGGGPGMVLKPDPVFKAVRSLAGQQSLKNIILLSPQGALFTQKKAHELSRLDDFALICGRYEGVDERVAQGLVTEELSIGDYVLNGGEAAALVVVEAVVRLIEGVVGEPASLEQDSFEQGLLDYPHYTRPREFEGIETPEILLSGHHAQIEQWRRRQMLLKTLERRPDLLEKAALTPEDKEFLLEFARKKEENTQR